VRELTAELLVGRLVDWGIDTVFGLPADSADGVVEAFSRHGDRIRLVLVHHEEAAALMAAGYAKATGRVGVCLATSGPGALRLLGGLYDAKLDHQPVLAVTESQEIRLLGTSFRQELALETAFDDVADYNVRVNVPVQIPAVVDIGIGHALARGTVSHITFPPGLEETAVETSPWMLTTPTGSPPTAPLFTAGPGVPPDADLSRAAEVLNEGARVALLVGAGGLEAREELLAVADAVAGPVIKSLPGKAAVPDDHPFTTGCIGVLGTRPSEEALEGADTLLLVGTSFPWAANVPDPAKVRAIQIETDPARLGGSGATEVTLLGDAAETLGALLPLLSRKADRGFLEQAQAGMAGWRRRLDELEDQTRDPIQPQYLMRVVDRCAAPDAILASDSGTVATWSARHFDVRGDRQGHGRAAHGHPVPPAGQGRGQQRLLPRPPPPQRRDRPHRRERHPRRPGRLRHLGHRQRRPRPPGRACRRRRAGRPPRLRHPRPRPGRRPRQPRGTPSPGHGRRRLSPCGHGDAPRGLGGASPEPVCRVAR
jgi:pyruvate dehydrogenase (quinone)/pyruvate oxidase